MRILVVCGAGASSTFIAQRMRVTLAARGLTAQVTATSELELGANLSNIDVLLVGPHLAPEYERICTLAASYGARARLLPPEVFSTRNGDASVDLALHAAAAAYPASPTPKETVQ